MECSLENIKTFSEMAALVAGMKNGLQFVLGGFSSLVNDLIDRQDQDLLSRDIGQIEATLQRLQEHYVLVKRSDLKQLQNEVKLLKDLLPKTLATDLLNSPAKLLCKEQEYQTVSAEKHTLEKQFQLLQKRFDSLLSEIEQERQDNADLRVQVSMLSSMSNEQSEYCAKLGCTTCALLWRVSQQDDIVPSMLNGDCGKEFIQIAGHTLDSYTVALQDDQVKLDCADTEHRFVLALVGVITNISASAFGREFMVSSPEGSGIIEILINLLKDLPGKDNPWMKLRNLILKALYNTSINRKGLKLICSNKGFFNLVASTIEGDKCSDNRLQAVRIAQSILYEPDCVETAHSIMELLTVEKLRLFAQNARGEVQNSLQELLTDIKLLTREQ